MSSRVVGLLPMAGSGTRLNLPTPKPLVPTLSRSGVKPLYWHAYRRLRKITSDIVFVLSPKAASDPCFEGLPGRSVMKPFQGELPTSISKGVEGLPGDTYVAVALPDSIWYPRDGFVLLYEYLVDRPWLDGAFGLFLADHRVLDEVVLGNSGDVKEVFLHAPATAEPKNVLGWGVFIARADALRHLSDARPLGPQLGEKRFGALNLGAAYYDLGTQERYLDHFAVDQEA